jgi:hypothetical protein
MFRYFIGSFIITIFGLLTAFLWGEHVHGGTGLTCIFIATVLAVLEISLSFDNAVVNAMKLEGMSPKWRHRFITWGILIAVFGMRFLFPLLVVAIFAGINILSVLDLALHDVSKYAYYLQMTHAPIVTFGGAFLMMLFVDYFTKEQKDVHWIVPIELKIKKLRKIKGICSYITLFFLGAILNFLPLQSRINVLFSGLAGIVTYLLINGLANWLEKRQEERAKRCADAVKCSGFHLFIHEEYHL